MYKNTIYLVFKHKTNTATFARYIITNKDIVSKMRISTFCTIVIYMCFLSIYTTKSQTHAQIQKNIEKFTLKGIVTDESGTPLIGVSIKNIKNGNGVITDINGNFEIKTFFGDRWNISYVGMVSENISINKKSFLQILLKENPQTLDEVVVTGYSKVNSRVFVGSMSKISSKEFDKLPQIDVSKLLEGKAPGLNIHNVSNTFGVAPKVNIRGGGSINGNIQPLWVVDGSVVEDIVVLNNEELTSGDAITLVSSTIAGLNVADIESIAVLKDASATSLYGARGMNGVIVVTSKSGKRKEGLNVSYDFTTSFRRKPSYSQFSMMNSYETMQIYNEMENKGLFSMNESLYGRRGGIYHIMYNLIDSYDGKNFGLENTIESKHNFLNKAALLNTDWFDKLYTNSLTQNHSLSFSYGGEKSATYASLSYYKDPGETIAEKISRFTTYLKSSYFFDDTFKISTSINVNLRDQYAPGTFPRIKNIESGAYKRDFDINPFNYALNTSRTLRPYNDNGDYEYYRNDWAPFNIIKEYNLNKMNISVSDVRFTIDGEWHPIKNMSITALFNTRHLSSSISHNIGEESNVILSHKANKSFLEKLNNIYLFKNDNNNDVVTIPIGGIYNKTSRSLGSYLGRLSADYIHNWGDHRIKLFSFGEIKMSDVKSDYFKGYGIGYENANAIITHPVIFEKTLNEGEQYFSLRDQHDRSVAFSGSITYDYKNRYVMNLVANYEGSNASGTGKNIRWLPTWNIGTKWNIDSENFFKKVKKYWNQLALRMSYGLVAKMNSEAINSLSVYDSKLTFRKEIDNREQAIYIKHLENQDLTWEKMYEFNIGTDMSFFDDRLNLTFDLFSRNSFDLIDLVRTSGIGGQYYKWANFGDMKTNGFDFSLNTVNIKSKNFNWETQTVFSYYNQEITRLLNSPNTFDMVSGNGRGNIEGFPRGGLYSFEFLGLTDRGLPQFYFGNLPDNGNKTFSISGANFYDTVHNRSYLLYEGPIEPFITASIGNTFNWNNWTLSFFISSQIGNKIRISPTFDPEYNDLNVFSTEYRNRWIVKGDEMTRNVPVIPGYDLYSLIGIQNIERAYNTYNYSNQNVADGSFVRFKNISLGYTFPPKFCKMINVKKASVHANANNLFLIYADKRLQGRDPEFVSSGGVASPAPQTYSLSFHINF